MWIFRCKCRRRHRRQQKRVRRMLLLILAVLIFSGCTTLPPAPVKLPPPAPLPPPTECLAAAFTSYPSTLSLLPSDWLAQSLPDKIRTLLQLKLRDATHYMQLRVQALRCAALQEHVKH